MCSWCLLVPYTLCNYCCCVCLVLYFCLRSNAAFKVQTLSRGKRITAIALIIVTYFCIVFTTFRPIFSLGISSALFVCLLCFCCWCMYTLTVVGGVLSVCTYVTTSLNHNQRQAYCLFEPVSKSKVLRLKCICLAVLSFTHPPSPLISVHHLAPPARTKQ